MGTATLPRPRDGILPAAGGGRTTSLSCPRRALSYGSEPTNVAGVSCSGWFGLIPYSLRRPRGCCPAGGSCPLARPGLQVLAAGLDVVCPLLPQGLGTGATPTGRLPALPPRQRLPPVPPL